MDTPTISHYGTVLDVPISKAFQYYSDVKFYPRRYPDYCGKVDKTEESSNNTFRTRELWYIALSNEIDHIVVNLSYTLSPPTSILYEVTDSSYEKLKGIKSGILFEEKENNQISMEYNNILLDAVSFPPHTTSSDKYNELLTYFPIKDTFHIRYNMSSPFKKGQLCGKCLRGHLQAKRTAEKYQVEGFKKRIDFWECDKCRFRYQGFYFEK